MGSTALDSPGIPRRTNRSAIAGTTVRHAAATEAILRIARSRHGVVTRAQLVTAGIPADIVDRRIARGLLVPLHRGVFGVALPLPPHGRALAALLACGGDSVVSHHTAAVLRDILPGGSDVPVVHVTLTRGDRRRPGIRIHRERHVAVHGRTPLPRTPASNRHSPAKEMNTPVAGFEVDAVWHAERLIIEIDGIALHSTSGRTAADRPARQSSMGPGTSHRRGSSPRPRRWPRDPSTPQPSATRAPPPTAPTD